MESIRLTTTLPGTPEEIYDAWISAKGHAAMTGAPATSEKKKGGAYTACDGYISGKHLELEPGRRVLQTWRTTEFPEGSPDSRLEVRFAVAPRGTKLTLLQSGIPDGQGEMYAEGWQDHYFEPMSRYFVSATPVRAKKAMARKSVSAKPASLKSAKSAKSARAAVRKTAKPPARKKSSKPGTSAPKKKSESRKAASR